MTEIQKTIPGKEIIAKPRGTATIYADQSFEFRADNVSDKPLYNDILVETKSGSVKLTDKSAVMRVVTDAKSPELRAELMHKAVELISKVPDDSADKLIMPDFCHLIGETEHSKVFLQKECVVVQTVIRFDEVDRKIVELLVNASHDQLKYLRQYTDPQRIYQGEVAAVCLLISNAKEKHEREEKVLNSKPRKSRRKDGSTK